MKRLLNVTTALSVCMVAANALAQRKLPVIPPPDQRMRVVVDTDAACEIDDLYAIALAVLCPQRFEIEGFVAAPFGDAGGPWDMLYTRHKTHGKILRLSDIDRDGTFALLYQRLEATYSR